MHHLGEQATRAAQDFTQYITHAEAVAMLATAIQDRVRFRLLLAVGALSVSYLLYLFWPHIKTETKTNLWRPRATC